MRLFALLLLVLLSTGATRAQGDIHRCMGANGVPVFTDRVCSDINAAPVAPPAPTSSVGVVAAPGAMSSQPPAVLCAADLEQLKQAVVDAFAVRNPNRLAGLMLWDGDGQGAVVADIQLFNRLMAHPLIDVAAEPAAATSSDTPPASSTSAPRSGPAEGETLVVRTEAEDGSGADQDTRFDVVHHDGCLWLHPVD